MKNEEVIVNQANFIHKTISEALLVHTDQGKATPFSCWLGLSRVLIDITLAGELSKAGEWNIASDSPATDLLSESLSQAAAKVFGK